jgi:peptide/nickel transport system permease protein
MASSNFTNETANAPQHVHTMFQIVVRQFLEHRMALTGLIVILFFILTAVFAPLLEGFLGVSPMEQNVFSRYQPIGTIVDSPSDSKEYQIESWVDENPERAKVLTQQIQTQEGLPVGDNPDLLFDLVLSEAESTKVLGTLAKVDSPEAQEFASLVGSFRKIHLLGTDELGRDVLMRLVYGARVSIGVGLLSALAAALIGLIMGTLAGYYGGWIDAALSRFTDALLSLPLLPLMIIFAAVDLANMPVFSLIISGQNESIAKLVVIIVLFSWMGVARLVRGSILSIKRREYVLAAKVLGASDYRTIISHIVPNVIAPLLVAVTLGVGQAILFESALSFLGLGIQPPTPSWGNMLFNAQELLNQSPFLAVFPGVLIFFTVVSFNFIGDGLQDAIDPKSIQR